MTHNFFGSRAAASMCSTVSIATNSSCVDWMAARGKGATRSMTVLARNVGSLGTLCVT